MTSKEKIEEIQEKTAYFKLCLKAAQERGDFQMATYHNESLESLAMQLEQKMSKRMPKAS